MFKLLHHLLITCLFFIGIQPISAMLRNQHEDDIGVLKDSNYHSPDIIENLLKKKHNRLVSRYSVADSIVRKRMVVKTDKKLEFIHINKNGGTSIELTAASSNIRWGRCHFLPCLDISPDIPRRAPSVWHKPLHFLPSNVYGDDAAIFVVVREPYDRTISYYYYSQAKKVDIDALNEPSTLNDFVKTNMQGDNYVNNFLPAYNYVFDVDSHDEVVDYVLRFEYLKEDFDYLINVYNLDLTLSHHNSRTKLGTEALDEESIQIINDYFYNDFIAFGYKMK